MCVYGMEGPGGYQFVGRTVQMWNRYRQTPDFIEGHQWLLRFFDQIRFYEVSQDELKQWRQDFPLGRVKLNIEQKTLKLSEYQKFLENNANEISAFKTAQQAAFEAERQRWEETGQATFEQQIADDSASSDAPFDIPKGYIGIASPVTSSVWKVVVKPGDKVAIGDELMVLEAMKMEIPLEADETGTVEEILCSQGSSVSAGQTLLILKLDGD